jgi:hypothetical protein
MLDRIDGELQRLAAEFDHLRGTLQDQAPSPPRPPGAFTAGGDG